MRRAAALSIEGHREAMALARPGRYEYELEAELFRAFRRGGGAGPAYGSIVASGPNATVLHYTTNNRRIEQGDLVLIDAGGEWEHYAADITRTFPASGRYSAAQRAVYELVLRAQRRAIATVKPGGTLDAVHDAALRVLVEGLIALGLVTGSPDQVLEEKQYQAFFMHRTSHWLGLDVHDAGRYYIDGKARVLAEGMALTVEPGLYIAADSEVDARWRGIGVRIEDDVVVTEQGCEVLTAALPVDIEALEELVQGQ